MNDKQLALAVKKLDTLTINLLTYAGIHGDFVEVLVIVHIQTDFTIMDTITPTRHSFILPHTNSCDTSYKRLSL